MLLQICISILTIVKVEVVDNKSPIYHYQYQFSVVSTLIDHRNDIKMFKNSSGTTSRRREVSQQNFKHFDVISMVDNRRDR